LMVNHQPSLWDTVNDILAAWLFHVALLYLGSRRSHPFSPVLSDLVLECFVDGHVHRLCHGRAPSRNKDHTTVTLILDNHGSFGINMRSVFINNEQFRIRISLFSSILGSSSVWQNGLSFPFKANHITQCGLGFVCSLRYIFLHNR
jgi:hypothetical protein